MKSSKRLQTHVEMRPSDIKQSFSVPSHWRVYRLRHLVKLNPSKQEIRHYSSDANVTFLPMESVSETGEISNALEKTISDVYSGYTYFREGDVILAKITPCFENGKAAVAHSLVNKIGFGSTEFHVLRPNDKLDVRFLFYIIKSDPFLKNGEANMVGAAGQKRVPESFLSDFKIAIPNIEEQKIISSFLDQQTAKLDQLVEKKQRLIHLLQEKRQALITQAVTKGLDPNVPMKDSGIKWLGEVPAHWRIEKLKYHVYLNPETLSENTDPEQELLYIEIGNVSSYGEISDATYYLFKNAPSRARRKVRSGDVIISTVRTYLKAITYIKDAPENLVVSTGFAVLRAKDQLLNSFLGKYVRNEGFINEIVARSVGVSYPAINASELIELWVVIPPIEEQRAIVDWLNSRLSNIDKIITNIEKQIATIQEYRQALITAAVTGQIDVLREKLAVSADPIPAGKE